jgi:hypothetical protein
VARGAIDGVEGSTVAALDARHVPSRHLSGAATSGSVCCFFSQQPQWRRRGQFCRVFLQLAAICARDDA